MEDWLKDAKELAKSEAEYFVKNLIDVANTNNLDAEWFVPPPEGSGFPPTSNERFYL